MTSYVTPKKNAAFKFYVALVDQSNTKLTKANPTIASGDFKVSTDGGAFANLATLPSANPASGRAVMIDCSAGEMNGDNIVIQCVDAAGAEWCDLILNIQTTARQIDDLAFPATSGRSMVVDANGLVDANAVKVGPTGSGTAQTAGDIPARLPAALTAGGNIKADALAWNGLTTVALPLIPTVAGRTLDCSAGGEAGVDWANVGSPTTAVNLSATTVNLTNTLTTYTGNTLQTADVATLITTVGAAGAGLTGVALSLAGRQAIATTALVESYAALHVAPTWAQAIFEIRALLAEKGVAGTTLTANKIDGSTPAETFTLNSATTPTAITRAS